MRININITHINEGCSFFVNKRNFTTSMDDIKKGKHFEIAEGLLDYTNHRIKELEDGDDYVLKQGLTCHLEQIKRSLADMQELQAGNVILITSAASHSLPVGITL